MPRHETAEGMYAPWLSIPDYTCSLQYGRSIDSLVTDTHLHLLRIVLVTLEKFDGRIPMDIHLLTPLPIYSIVAIDEGIRCASVLGRSSECLCEGVQGR